VKPASARVLEQLAGFIEEWEAKGTHWQVRQVANGDDQCYMEGDLHHPARLPLHTTQIVFDFYLRPHG
jgi:hypothetical protein